MEISKNIRNGFTRLIARVFKTVGHRPTAAPDLEHWKTWAFGITLAYCMPLSLIAIAPALYAAYADEYSAVIVFDVMAALLLVVLALVPGIRLGVRKGLFMGLIYTLGLMLLYYFGHSGPGLLFLQTAAVFSILFYRLRYALMYLLLNLVICLGIAMIMGTTDLDIPLRQYHDHITWISESASLLFISAVLILLIHQLLHGLEQTVKEQQRLREEVSAQAAELKRSLHEVEQRNEELDQFAYVASHDLQEPLRMVTGFLDRLSEKYNDRLDDRARQYIHFAHDGAVRMRQSILDLLDYSRTGRDHKKAEAVDMTMLFNGLRGDLAEGLKETEGIITYSGPDTLRLPEEMLRQVLLNLASNALKYHREGVPPEVQVKAKTEGASVQFSVKDNGIGIGRQHFDRIFHIFQRLHGRDEYSGTGIGLAICRKNVERYGGRIWVESQEGQGTTFHFVLPLEVGP